MTSLLIDLGNTRLKWARARQGRLVPGSAGAVDAGSGVLPLAEWCAQPVAQVLVAAVATTGVIEPLLRQLHAAFVVPVIRLQTWQRWHDLVNGYRRPADLGIDRWLALIAARRAHPARSLVVINAGTALTVDALAADGRHLGGLIAPGLTTLRRGLLAAAPSLERHGDGRESDAWTQASDDAIASGCLQAALGLIDRARHRLDRAQRSLVLLAGGDASRLLPWLAEPVSHRPHLVLEGLACCAWDHGGPADAGVVPMPG